MPKRAKSGSHSAKVSPSEVTLVPLKAAHAAAMVRWLSDPEVSSNLGLRAKPTLARTKEFIKASNTDPVCGRAILLEGVHVGVVVLDQIDRRVGKTRLYIYVGDPRARGHGVGQRAVALASKLAFEELGLHKVWLTVHVQNLGAIRAYEAAGFSLEGTHRAEFVLGSDRIDEHYMGILRTDIR